MPSPRLLHSRRNRLVIPALVFTLASTALLAQQPAPPGTRVLVGHTDPVYAVAVSPDAKYAATGSFDKTIKLWDAASGKELRTLAGKTGHTNQVLCLGFSANGDALASGGSDNFAKVWDVPSSKPSLVLDTPANTTCVAVSPDGKLYATGLADGSIKLWTSADGKPGVAMTGHAGPVAALAFSANNATLTSVGTDRTLRQWTVAKGEPAISLGASVANVTGLGVSASGATFTASADGQLKFWPALAPNPAKPLPPLTAAITALTFSADGTTATIGLADKSVRLIPIATGKETLAIPGLPADVKAVVSAGPRIAIGTADGTLHMYGNDGKLRAKFPAHTGGIVAMDVIVASGHVLTVGATGEIRTWTFLDTQPKEPAPKPVAEFKPGAGATAVAYLAGASTVATTGSDKAVRLWDAAMKKEVKVLGNLPNAGTVLAASRDGATVAAASGKDVKLWTVADGKEIATFAAPADVLSLSFSSDKKRLIVGLANNQAWVYDLDVNQPVQFVAHAGPVIGVWCAAVPGTIVTVSQDKTIAVTPLPLVKTIVDPTAIGGALVVTPSGGHVLTAGSGKGVIAWNAGNAAKEKTFETDGAVTALAVTKDGQRVAIAHGADPTITLFNWNDGVKIGSYKAGGKVGELAFHPTGPTLFSSRADNRVIAWNIAFDAGQPLPPEFGKAVQEFPHATPVKSLAISLDGSHVLTASDDKQAKLWKFASDQPSKTFQHPNLVDAVAIDKTGTTLATGCHDGILRLWDLTKPPGQPTKAINAHTMPTPQPIYAVVWTPDGKKIATACFDRTIKIWDAATGNLVKEIKGGKDILPNPKEKTPPKPEPGHLDQVFTLAFTPNGQFLASGSSDRTIKLWDANAGTLVRDFPNPNFKPAGPGQPTPSHPGFVHALKITPDGAKLVSVGTAPRNQGYLAVWNIADGKLLTGQELTVGPIYSCDLTPNEILLGCGPKVRQQSASEALFVPLLK